MIFIGFESDCCEDKNYCEEIFHPIASLSLSPLFPPGISCHCSISALYAVLPICLLISASCKTYFRELHEQSVCAEPYFYTVWLRNRCSTISMRCQALQ